MALAGCAGEDDGTPETQTTSAGGGGDETDNTEADDDEETETPGETELQLINATMSSLDPVQASDTASSEVTTQIFDGLLNWVDGGVPVDTRLAADFSISDDFLTYTFKLKEGVTFHNGDEVTAQDVVYSWERLAASPNSQAPADILSAVNIEHEEEDGSYVPGSMEMEAVDDYTVRFTLAAPFASATQVMANNQFAVVPEGIVGDIEGYDGEMDQGTFASENPIGAGPFVFKSWESGTEAEVSAYEDYHGSGPEVDGIHWQIIADPSARFNYAMNKNADMFAIPTSQFKGSKLTVDRTDEKGRQRGTYSARNGETLEVTGVPTLSYFYIGFNMPEVPKAVRQSMAYVMNQHTIANQVFKNRAVPGYHTMTPSIFPGGADAYEQHASENYPYGYNQADIEGARQVMEEAGYSASDPYELEWLQYQSPTWLSTAQTLRDKLSSAHIDMQIEQAPFSTLLERVRNLNVEAYTLAWIVPWAAPDAFVKHLDPARSDPTGSGPAEMFVDWPTDTDAAQKAIDAWGRIQNNPLANEEDTKIREQAAIEMEEANWEDVANLPVYHTIEQRFHYDNVDVDPFGVGGSYKQKHDSTTVDR
jgi:peptide/nickel transport system substrate-binding protein